MEPLSSYFESLEVVDENIWKPQLVDQLQVDRNHGLCGAVGVVQVSQEPFWDMKARLSPHHIEI